MSVPDSVPIIESIHAAGCALRSLVYDLGIPPLRKTRVILSDTMKGRNALKLLLIICLMSLGGCTLADRNVAALTLCQRTAGCTVSSEPPSYGPPQVQVMEGSRRTSKTTEK